jgi:antitoxin FitA
LELAVPVALTLKNVPDAVYERLRDTAARNRRSLNSEAIVCLEAVLLPRTPNAEEQLARASALRATQVPVFRAKDIDAAKRAGRE